MEATTEKKVTPRKPNVLREASFFRAVYPITVDAGAAVEDVLKPEFWAHVGMYLKPSDRIEVLTEDMAWFAELIVLDAERTWAKVAMLRFVELAGRGEEVATPAPEYEIRYKGPEKKHVIVRLSDKVVVQEGIALKVEAEAWIREHVKSIAR